MQSHSCDPLHRVLWPRRRQSHSSSFDPQILPGRHQHRPRRKITDAVRRRSAGSEFSRRGGKLRRPRCRSTRGGEPTEPNGRHLQVNVVESASTISFKKAPALRVLSEGQYIRYIHHLSHLTTNSGRRNWTPAVLLVSTMASITDGRADPVASASIHPEMEASSTTPGMSVARQHTTIITGWRLPLAVFASVASFGKMRLDLVVVFRSADSCW